MTVKVYTENERMEEDIQLFPQFWKRKMNLLSERLHLLATMLLDMGCEN